jgi:uncharacterized membrane protein YkvA (DUF1232 family)
MTNFSIESIYAWYRRLVANPKYRWWVVAATLCYLFSPIDIVPDLVPFIGQIDDAIVVGLLVTELAQLLLNWSSSLKQQKMARTRASAPSVVDVEAVDVQ